MLNHLLLILLAVAALASANRLRYTGAGAPAPISQEIAEQTCTGDQKHGTRLRFYDGCNWCRCTSDPGLAFCHRRGCPDLTSANVGARITERMCTGVRTSGRQFYDGCNWCTCGATSNDAVCTMRMCA